MTEEWIKYKRKMDFGWLYANLQIYFQRFKLRRNNAIDIII